MGCASRGQRETDDLEKVKVIDPERVAHAAATSKRIVREALLTSVAMTLLFVAAV